MSRDLVLAYYCVAFIDMLGQRARLRELTDLPTTDEEKAEVLAILRDTVGAVRHLRTIFDDYFDRSRHHSPEWDEFVSQLPKQHRESVRAARQSQSHRRQISDSVLVWVCLREPGEQTRPAEDVLSMLLATAAMQLFSLALQRPVRGAVDVGLAVDIGPDEIYGPVLESVISLEHQSAGYPRVVIGDGLQAYLNTLVSLPPASPLTQIARVMADSARRLLFTDQDGARALDFFGAEFRRYATSAVPPIIIQEATTFVEGAHGHWSQAGCTKLAERYALLLQYLNPRRNLWVGDNQIGA
jgi:hypothetical protein